MNAKERAQQRAAETRALSDIEFPENPRYLVTREVIVGEVEDGDGHPHIALMEVALADMKRRWRESDLDAREAFRVKVGPMIHSLTLEIQDTRDAPTS